MIYYDEEKQAWALDKITEEEKNIILGLGTDELFALMGAAILRQLNQQQVLEQIPNEDMAQA